MITLGTAVIAAGAPAAETPVGAALVGGGAEVASFGAVMWVVGAVIETIADSPKPEEPEPEKPQPEEPEPEEPEPGSPPGGTGGGGGSMPADDGGGDPEAPLYDHRGLPAYRRPGRPDPEGYFPNPDDVYPNPDDPGGPGNPHGAVAREFTVAALFGPGLRGATVASRSGGLTFLR